MKHLLRDFYPFFEGLVQGFLFVFNAFLGVSYRLNFHKDFVSAAEIEYEESKKEEKQLKKTMKKNNKAEKKRARKAKRN